MNVNDNFRRPTDVNFAKKVDLTKSSIRLIGFSLILFNLPAAIVAFILAEVVSITGKISQ